MSEVNDLLEAVQKFIAIHLEQKEALADLQERYVAAVSLMSPPSIGVVADQPVRVVTGVSTEDEPE
jgi:hypothetical protein